MPALYQLAPHAQFVAEGRPFADVEPGLTVPGTDMPDPGYYTVAEIEMEIDAVVSAHPMIAQKVNLSTLTGFFTHDGRSIFALKVSDNVAIDEDERAIIIAAQHHARELNSPHMVIGAMQRVTSAYGTDPDLTNVVNDSEIWFVPMVNPDGVHHVWTVDNFWRKNRRPNGGSSFGVDLNRNFDFNWTSPCDGSNNPNSSTYRGPSAASEPETQVMQSLSNLLAPEIYLDFHSSGQEVLHTYPPCVSINPTLTAYITTYANDLRAPMGFAFRFPSASGEAPEHHWARNGTMSFLIEIGTSFQPPFSVTIAEENTVWPGVRHALTTWAPAVRGHVRSLFQNEPIEATITVSPSWFNLGEGYRSRARDGRYALWLGTGQTYQVTYAAPGFLPHTETVTVTSLNNPQTREVVLVPDFAPITLDVLGAPTVGSTIDLELFSQGDGGLPYLVLLSGDTTPGIVVGPRTIPLREDGLLGDSVFGLGGLLTNNFSVLPVASETATASFTIPPLPFLAGVTLYAGGLTLELGYPALIKKFTPAVPITFLP